MLGRPQGSREIPVGCKLRVGLCVTGFSALRLVLDGYLSHCTELKKWRILLISCYNGASGLRIGSPWLSTMTSKSVRSLGVVLKRIFERGYGGRSPALLRRPISSSLIGFRDAQSPDGSLWGSGRFERKKLFTPSQGPSVHPFQGRVKFLCL